ncbi:AEC family transporter [Lipingzhangella sp. LS1_29]|uniref:AEC family transporter n=1 Tax=Lipingzhangella rawalii TaxID=2055835 RepID=A0ABU2H6E6_9ACTN|nr:AEC family transporter [Lipingzhangella rawalii]MDS1270878.1 AEC family transporter [Lipingzhangella rawalii]
MSGVATGFGVIATVVAVGYVLGWRNVLGDSGREALTKLAFYVATPALLFEILSDADLSVLYSAPLAVLTLSVAVVAGLYLGVGLLLRWGVGPTTMGALCSSYVNAGNLGIPIAVYVLGDTSLIGPVILMQQLLLTPVALTVLDQSSRAPGHRSGILRILSMPLRTPIVIGSLTGLAVAVSGWSPPAPVAQPIELLASMSVPAVLLAFGISLHGDALPGRGPERVPVALAVALKSVAHPAVAWALGSVVFGLSPAELYAVVIVAALPAAQNLFNYSSRYGVATRMTRESVLLSTFLTVPVLVLITMLLG